MNTHNPMPDLSLFVDAEWYLARYPDVAQAGVNPQTHFEQNGYAEGRLPCALQSANAEYYLWRGVQAPMQERLVALQQSENALERAYASWALARWHAQRGEWWLCFQAISHFHAQPTPLPGHPGPWLLQVEAAAALGKHNAGFAALNALRSRFSNNTDAYLAHSNLLGALGATAAARLAALAPLWRANGLKNSGLKNNGLKTTGLAVPQLLQQQWQFDALSASAVPLATVPAPCPCITVMVPMFNAASGIETALRGLLAQTWPAIELVLVDDASEDATLATVKRVLAHSPPRQGITVQVLRHQHNQGAYAARNTALAHASGALITTHDSDDWSHPQKLAAQAQALLADTSLMGCFSHWVRADDALHFTHWCMETGWIYRNVSSLMLRREAVQQLGFWDNVKAAADTEYHRRAVAVFGEGAFTDVLPGVPLAIGRQAEGSLTQTSATHLITMFQGVRQQYADAYQRWHRTFKKPADAFMPRQPTARPFPAPANMCRNAHSWCHCEEPTTKQSRSPRFARDDTPKATPDRRASLAMTPNANAGTLVDTLQQSPWWDAGWYLRQYPDLWEGQVNPFTHFMTHGAAEGRDPSPLFSSSAYAVRYAKALSVSGQRNPLVHFITQGRRLGFEPLPSFQGQQAYMAHRPTVLLCGHQAPAQPFGAERCLVDTARALAALNVNVVVVLPALHIADYWQALEPYVLALHVVPYAWWHHTRPVCAMATQALQSLIHRWKVDVVHVNTLVHDAPCMAAQAEGKPLVVHAHELPSDNRPLCEALGATPEEIRQRTLGLASVVVANSQAVAAFFEQPQQAIEPVLAPAFVPVEVVPNTLDMGPLLSLPPCPALASANAPLRVGMLSSHQPEKGLEDVVALASALAADPIELHLVGPETPALSAIRARQARGELASIKLQGYVDTPEQALAELDVVMNLSSVKESFGRTVLEAMTAGRAVVCYRWGALPELVTHNVTGLLAEQGDTATIAQHLRYLATHRDALARMGQAGQQHALAHYTPRQYVNGLARVYRTLLPGF